jgi:hypothetical protein
MDILAPGKESSGPNTKNNRAKSNSIETNQLKRPIQAKIIVVNGGNREATENTAK